MEAFAALCRTEGIIPAIETAHALAGAMRLGRELGLFHIDEAVGQGLILWKPKGALVRRALQEFITQELDKQGYSQVFTPHIGKLDLYRTSGHFPYY